MPSIETLPFLCKQLRLSAVKEHWRERMDKAEQKQSSYGEFLAELLTLELTLREQRKLERAYKASKLPPGKSLTNFNFEHLNGNNGPRIKQLALDRKWVDDIQNLILIGPSGLGKTHIAAAIGYALLDLGVHVLFTTTTLMVQSLQQAKADFKLKEALEKLARYQLIILDDIGYVRKSEQETSVLFELIAQRYETGSLLITANQPFSDWETLFPDPIMAVAAIDRLVHHAHIMQFEGESYRATQAKKQLQKQED